MEKPEPSNETHDPTPIEPDRADSADSDVAAAATKPGAEPSIELAIETLAGLDAAAAPDLADDLAGRLRAELSDS